MKGEKQLTESETGHGPPLYHARIGVGGIGVCVPEKIKAIEKGWMKKHRLFSDKPTGTSGYGFNMRKLRIFAMHLVIYMIGKR